MKVLILAYVLIGASFAQADGPPPLVNWAQPPLGCLEDLIPQKPKGPCLDLSRVKDVTLDFPVFSKKEDEAFWNSPQQRRPLQYCRSVELLRREKLGPGTFSAGAVQVSEMRMSAVNNSTAKLQSVMSAAQKYKMPAFILFGALMQESVFADLGISDDGGNFSCGLGQINLVEWCGWANEQTPDVKIKINWPANPVDCGSLRTEWVRPLYNIALPLLGNGKVYQLNKSYFQNIKMADVQATMPGKDVTEQAIRFGFVQSFINNCSESSYGIEAKAHELSQLYKLYVPMGLKNSERYATGDGFHQRCIQKDNSGFYPLHTGWLLAVAAYNAGPRATDVYAHYFQWDNEAISNSSTFAGFHPPSLIEGLYWGGSYNSETDKIDFTTLGGAEASNLWFKQCVMHQHIVRVVQHNTLPGFTLANLLLKPGEECAKSQFDPDTQELIQTKVPVLRQKSSGIKDEL